MRLSPMWRNFHPIVLVALALMSVPAILGADPLAKSVDPDHRAKTTTVGLSPSWNREGIVGKIDADNLLLVEFVNGLEVREHHVLPNDVLQKGKVLRDTDPRFAYRWEDVNAGDKVELRVAEDHIDKQMYCLEISIIRRPKGRLPASQKETEDEAFPRLRVCNDLENGVDVSDEEIMKVYPPRAERRDPRTNALLVKAYPGGLSKENQAKLDAIRAKKKDKDLKAGPPDKK
jgi:hypothetical protein